jgi:transposase
MQTWPASLTDNVEQLQKLIVQLHQQLDEKNRVLQQKDKTISTLHYQLKSALQFRFGKKSEKATNNQLGLFDEADLTAEEQVNLQAADEEITVASFTRKKGGRRPLPADLPREQVIHDLPEAEKQCACGHALHKMGEDKSEQFEFIPAQVKVIEHIRYKYACRHCEAGVKVATLPPQPIPKSIATPGLLAHILVSKYYDHIPLYRQEHILQRYQIDISRSTLCHWVLTCGEVFQPFVGILKKRLLENHYIGVDETPVQVLAETTEKLRSRCYMWVYLAGPPQERLILYDYQPTRGSSAVNTFLAGFKGYLQTDGYGGYHALQAKADIIGVGCWSHVRRKFMEIVKVTKTQGQAWEAVKRIRQLYAIEREAQEQSWTIVQQMRQAKAKPLIDDFKQWLEKTLLSTPPQSPLAKAIQYALNQWPLLLTYLDNGELRIDNNAVENAIRPFALGRKNWMFMGNERGAVAAANIYSILMTAKANQLEPYCYLRYLLEQLPSCKTDEERQLLLPHYYKTRLKTDQNKLQVCI